MKSFQFTTSLFTLIAVNLIPLIGARYANWNIFSVMLGYWLETAVIGYFTVKRMKYVAAYKHENTKDPFSTNIFLLPFFFIHFGIFMLVHLIFVLAFFFSSTVSLPGLIIMVVTLFLSHYLSYQKNFIGNHEYKVLTPETLLWRPYPRVIAMHLTVILGGFFVLGTQNPTGGLVLLIILKTIADASTHIIEHSLLAKQRALV